MAQDNRPATGKQEKATPYWSQALRALREARGITQDGWSAQLGYGRATIRRWEAGQTVPSADAETAIVDACSSQRLFRAFTDGPLAGVRVTPEWIADLLATARLTPGSSPPRAAPGITFAAPTVFYAHSDDVAIAYQIVGDGPIDIVIVPGAVSHREIDWEHPGVRSFVEDLTGIARVIVFDKRGTGMSDRVATGTMEERMDDIRAVMAAAGSSQAVLVGISEGGPLSILFAATWPNRTSALVLYGTFGKVPAPSPDVPLQPFDHLIQTWGTPNSGFLDRFGPSAAADPGEREWWARLQRVSASPGAVRDLNQMNANLDVRAALPAVHVPTLVLHRTGDRVTELVEGQRLARNIPGARMVELPGNDHLPYVGNVEDITAAITGFVAHMRETSGETHVLATMLYADTGDEARAPLRELTRRHLARWRGREVPAETPGVLAMFDGPTRVIRCASAIRNEARSDGIEVRMAIHTGEVEAIDDQVTGQTVDACRVLAGAAEPGEVLVSGATAGLVTSVANDFVLDGPVVLDEASHTPWVFRVQSRQD